MAGTSPRIGSPRVKLDANTRTGARPKCEPRWNFEDNPGGPFGGDVAKLVC